jgi:hypothetical protein
MLEAVFAELINDPRKSFYSMRHTFVDGLKNANVLPGRVNDLLGWSEKGMMKAGIIS